MTMIPEIRSILESTDCVSVHTYHGHLNGIQVVVRFKNDYGTSVVRNDMSYGVGLAVVKFFGLHEEDWDFCYDTPITRGILCNLTPEALAQALQDISKL